MTSPLLSIIIPIFRSEKYLDTCIQSVLHQDMAHDEVEMILVDDGSDDNCPQLCDQYAQEHDGIHVIHQSNQGLSAARNTGLQHSRGRYVLFVDSDDYLQPQILSTVIAQCEAQQLDVLQLGYRVVKDGHMVGHHQRYVSAHVVDGVTFLNYYLDALCYAWRYVIRRDMLLQHSLFFTPGLSYEDVDFTPRMLLQAQRVASTNIFVYTYVLHSGSLTHPCTVQAQRRMIENHLDAIERLVQKQTLSPDCYWFRSMISYMIVAALTLVSHDCYENWNEYYQRIVHIYASPLTSQRSFACKDRWKITWVNVAPHLYGSIRHGMYKIMKI